MSELSGCCNAIDLSTISVSPSTLSRLSGNIGSRKPGAILAEVAHPRAQDNAQYRDCQADTCELLRQDARRKTGAERDAGQDLELRALPTLPLVGRGHGEAGKRDAECAHAGILPWREGSDRAEQSGKG
jgi:hypothetical protein